KPDGNFVPLLPNHSKRFITTSARHQVWKNARQNHPEVIWNATVALGAKRAVFEMFCLVRKDFFLLPEKFFPRKEATQRNEEQKYNRANPDDAFRFWLQSHGFSIALRSERFEIFDDGVLFRG